MQRPEAAGQNNMTDFEKKNLDEWRELADAELQDVWEQAIEYARGYLSHDDMNDERQVRQQAIDSLEEYDAIAKKCPQ